MATVAEIINAGVAAHLGRDVVERLVDGFMTPTLSIPKEEWHRRHRGVNRAAGVIVGWALAQGGKVPASAQLLTADVERRFAGDSSAPDYANRVYLCTALTKRVVEVLVEMGL